MQIFSFHGILLDGIKKLGKLQLEEMQISKNKGLT